VRGDHEVNEVALKKLCGARELFLASDKQIEDVTGAPVGFAGPIGLRRAEPGGAGPAVPVFADEELRGLTDAATGANQVDAHFVGVDMARDVAVAHWGSLRQAGAGDACPRCAGGVFEVLRGIEVGHVFYLDTKYTEPMKCAFLDEAGQTRLMHMGCYGIGITRTAAAAIEQHHDEAGIAWPLSIAPYEVTVLSLQPKSADVVAAADALVQKLVALGVEVLYDDRAERAGVKFKDADLIGIPFRLAVGQRALGEGKVELKLRHEAEVVSIDLVDAAETVADRVKKERQRLRSPER
jgi:prolyl-tRNA synthetase